MVKSQDLVINKSRVLTDEQAQSTLPERLQVQQDFTSACDSAQQEPILCCYVNATNHIQITRSADISNWYFERVVFPGQCLLFEALPEAQIEIHTGTMVTAILSDRISCSCLRVH